MARPLTIGEVAKSTGVAAKTIRYYEEIGVLPLPGRSASVVMGALADAVDLSAPFVVGAVLLAATAWRCHRRANAVATAAIGGHDR